MSVQIKPLAEQLITIRDARRNLEDKAKELKAREQSLQDAILNEMSATGMKSVNLDGLARLTSKVSSHYEIRDHDLFAKAVLARIVEAAKNGTPLQEGLLLQFRASRERIDAVLENIPEAEHTNALTNMGLALAEKLELSITKSK